MSKFQIGEMTLHAPINGIRRECQIVELPKDRMFMYEDGIHFWTDLYLIAFMNGEVITCAEQYLRKLPPKQGTTTWEDIQQITGWVPNKQGVES